VHMYDIKNSPSTLPYSPLSLSTDPYNLSSPISYSTLSMLFYLLLPSSPTLCFVSQSFWHAFTSCTNKV
jgi:hypothetical protein